MTSSADAMKDMAAAFPSSAHAALPEALHWRRILCYGDSLTAGFYAYGQKFSPYGAALEEALCSLGFQCEVSICGLSGHSARRMVEELDSPLCRDICGKPGKGLAHILDEDGPFDLVVLMAGTNDFAQYANLESIKNEVCKLHDACHIRNVPTVMLAAPCNTQEMQLGLRRILSNWASSQPEVLAFVDPELVIPRNQVLYWEPDSVHFSPLGSRALGIHLAPAIAKILRQDGVTNPAPPTPRLQERRIDPMLDGRSVTYAEMLEGLRDQDLSEAQLQDHWLNLQAEKEKQSTILEVEFDNWKFTGKDFAEFIADELQDRLGVSHLDSRGGSLKFFDHEGIEVFGVPSIERFPVTVHFLVVGRAGTQVDNHGSSLRHRSNWFWRGCNRCM